MKKLSKVIMWLIICMCIFSSNIMHVQAGSWVTIKTITGNGYVAAIHGWDSESNNGKAHYFSESKGYDSYAAGKISTGAWYDDNVSYNFGSTSSSKVRLFENEYFTEGSYMLFQMTGTSCSHAGSSATVYVTTPDGTEITVGSLTVAAGSATSPKTVSIRYEVTEAGYYTAKAIGKANGCTSSNGHGIYMTSQYTIQEYREQYEFVYDANGGTNAPASHTNTWTSQNKVIGSISSQVPTRPGYIFRGWAYGTDWTDKRIDANTDTGKNAASDGTIAAQVTSTWGVEEYKSGLGIDSLPTTIKLYAQWEPCVYTVNIYKNQPVDATSTIQSSVDATWTNNNTYYSKVFNYDQETLPLTSVFSLKGWTVNSNWYTIKSGNNGGTSGTAFPGGSKNLTETNGATVNVYAGWTKNSYTIVYSGNNTDKNIYGDTATTTFTGSTATTNCQYDTDVTLATNGFSKVGYLFKEWNTKSDGTGTSYSQGQKLTKPNFTAVDGGSITLYAIWEPITYTIRFNGNNNWNTSQGAYTSTELLGHELRYDEPIKLENKFSRIAPFTKDGKTYNQSWIFRGWVTDPNTTTFAKSTVNSGITCSADNSKKEIVYNFISTQAGIYNLYASWERETILTFNMNGGEYNNNSDSIMLKSTIYNNQMEYPFHINKNLTEEKVHYYTVQTNSIDAYGTYAANGVNSKYTKVDSEGTIYRFLGWSTNKNATVPDESLDVFNTNRTDTYTIQNDTTLYAVWEEILTADISWTRPLGNLEFAGGTVPTLKLTKLDPTYTGEYKMQILIRPSEIVQYFIKTTCNNVNTKITFDTRITDIYTHGDSTSTWYDELNPSTSEDQAENQKHGLNRYITGNKNINRRFHIPLYLGTEWSYDTSNPNKTTVPVDYYTVDFHIFQESHFYKMVYNKIEEIHVTGELYLVQDESDNSDPDNPDPTPEIEVEHILNEMKTTIK